MCEIIFSAETSDQKDMDGVRCLISTQHLYEAIKTKQISLSPVIIQYGIVGAPEKS